MQMTLATWSEVATYLEDSRGIVIPIGSTEQHGPNGLLGTDAICPEAICRAAGDEAGFLVAPTFNVGVAQHHMGFPGTITLRPSTMIAALQDWIGSLTRHGFRRLLFVNGHGGNVATINAAFAEAYAPFSLAGEPAPFACALKNWWDLAQVEELSLRLFPRGIGSHATPAEVSVTYAVHPEAQKRVAMTPRIAPQGPIRDAQDFRSRFPDGRIGSDPAPASPEAGEKLIAAAKDALIQEARLFFEEHWDADDVAAASN